MEDDGAAAARDVNAYADTNTYIHTFFNFADILSVQLRSEMLAALAETREELLEDMRAMEARLTGVANPPASRPTSIDKLGASTPDPSPR